MSASRRVYEQRMIQRRDQEQTNQNLESYVKSHTTMKANASSEPKIEAMRRAKMQAAIRSDIRADAEMMQADSDARASAWHASRRRNWRARLTRSSAPSCARRKISSGSVRKARSCGRSRPSSRPPT